MVNRASKEPLDLGCVHHHLPLNNLSGMFYLPVHINPFQSTLKRLKTCVTMCKCCERKRSEPVIFLPAGKEGIQRRARGQGESILHTTTSSLLSQELAQLIYDEFVHLCSVSKHCFDLFFLFCFVLSGRKRRDRTNGTTRTRCE